MRPAAGTPVLHVLLLCVHLLMIVMTNLTMSMPAPALTGLQSQRASSARTRRNSMFQPTGRKVKRDARNAAKVASFISPLGHSLAIYPNGSVKGTQDYNSPYTVMHVVSRRTNVDNAGSNLLRGAATGRFLCHSPRRGIFSSDYFIKKRCTFYMTRIKPWIQMFLFDESMSANNTKRQMFLSISPSGRVTLEPLSRARLARTCSSRRSRPRNGRSKRRRGGRRRSQHGTRRHRFKHRSKSVSAEMTREPSPEVVRARTNRPRPALHRRKLPSEPVTSRPHKRKPSLSSRKQRRPHSRRRGGKRHHRRRHRKSRRRNKAAKPSPHCERVNFLMRFRDGERPIRPKVLRAAARENRRRLRSISSQCRLRRGAQRPALCGQVRVRRSTVTAPLTTQSYVDGDDPAVTAPSELRASRGAPVVTELSHNSTVASVAVSDEPLKKGSFRFLPAGEIPPVEKWPPMGQMARMDLFSCANYTRNSRHFRNCRRNVRNHMQQQQYRADLKFAGLRFV